MELPSWAKRKPVARGLLVPTALRATIAKALGPLERDFGMKSKVPLYVTPSVGWGFTRQLAVDDAGGARIAKAIDILAKHELPLTGLHLWYPPTTDAGTANGAARVLTEVLAAKAVDRLRVLKVLLHRVKLDAAIAKTLASAIARMPILDELDLRAAGGGDVGRIIDAAPALRALALVNVGATGVVLRSLASHTSLASLERLELNDSFDDQAITALLAAPWVSSLRSLHLAPSLQTSTHLRGIETLGAIVELRLARVSATGMSALVNAPFVPNLRELHLGGATITDAIAARLAKRGLPSLEVLHVKYASASAKALDPIVKAAPQLKLLEVPPMVRVPKTWVKRGRQIL